MGSLLRICAITAASLVALGFVLFAVDESGESSKGQVQAIDGPAPAAEGDRAIDRPAPRPAAERVREARHSGARELIDDADDVLLAPFTGIVSSDDAWVAQLVPTALALLLYGLGGLWLANLIPTRRRDVHDWREATG